MDKFGKYNDNESIKFVVADKDMIEWDAISEKRPSAVLQMCLFHILRSICIHLAVKTLLRSVVSGWMSGWSAWG